MKKGDFNFKGFTIIEVSLVLAIAGLIFLMIFIALPALQRQQRDTARKEDITALISAVKKYQTNNRGALPTNDSSNTTSWKVFIGQYLSDGFEDPSTGEEYKWEVSDCGKNKAGETCTKSSDAVAATFPNGFKMYIIESAKCAGDETVGAIQTTNPRKIAVLYRLESGGLYCDNS